MPRDTLFSPIDTTDCPIPIKYLDVLRYTRTNLDSQAEARIDDVWDPDTPNGNGVWDPDTQLSASWMGTSSFDILRTKPPAGHEWVAGRPTRIH